MDGKWLSPTRHAKVWKVKRLEPMASVTYDDKRFDLGWCLALSYGDMFDYETFWYPTWQMAMAAIPQLWRH